MLISPVRYLAVLTVLTVLSASGRGDDVETATLKPGEYNGLWHGDKVKFIFEKVHKDGVFSGVVRFPEKSRFPNATFVFSGKLANDGSITIDRDPKNDPQTSHAKKPKEVKGHLVWEGKTTGADLDPKEKFPFELRIPLDK